MTKLREDYKKFFSKKFENKNLKEIISITKRELEFFSDYLNNNFNCIVDIEFTRNNRIIVNTSYMVREPGFSSINEDAIEMKASKLYNNLFNDMYRMNEFLENETHMNILTCLFDEKEEEVLDIFESYFYSRVISEEKEELISKIDEVDYSNKKRRL